MLKQFIVDNQHADVAQLALQRGRYPMLSDSDFRYGLQQIEGRQRTREKLPTFATIDGWLYPPRLNLEQCSSERTARFKASLLSSIHPFTLIDCTGGYGVDTFFMSEQAQETHYFEQNTDLAAIAEHNFRLAGKEIHCHAVPFDVSQLESLLAQRSLLFQRSGLSASAVLYLDPARRDSHGGKVFRLEDCTPNVTDIVRYVQQNCQNVRVLLKLSPMLDFHQAVAQLGGSWDIYVVSVNNEVKELLLDTPQPPLRGGDEKMGEIRIIHAVVLGEEQREYCFTPEEEQAAQVSFIEPSGPLSLSPAVYLYEPDAAILKAGAFRSVGARYKLMKAAPNTHLYFATQIVENRNQLPGRWWQVVGVYTRAKEVQRALTRANVLTRNYVLPADALRGQLRLKDGGDDYIVGCRIADKPLLLHCRLV